MLPEFHIRSHVTGHCGDIICLISAAIEFAERVDGVVYINSFRDVIEAYNHPRLKFGTNGVVLTTSAPYKHRNKHPGLFVNILGTYYSELGVPIVESPELQLPQFEKCVSRAVIQTDSVFARNPSAEYVQGIVDEFISLTGMTVYVIGKTKGMGLKNVDYSLVRDSVPFFMQQVQNAVCVLTPRSFAANLAAGYHVPAFMWSPSDGEDWHINYRGWRGVKCNFDRTPDWTVDHLRRFVSEFVKVRKD